MFNVSYNVSKTKIHLFLYELHLDVLVIVYGKPYYLPISGTKIKGDNIKSKKNRSRPMIMNAKSDKIKLLHDKHTHRADTKTEQKINKGDNSTRVTYCAQPISYTPAYIPSYVKNERQLCSEIGAH